MTRSRSTPADLAIASSSFWESSGNERYILLPALTNSSTRRKFPLWCSRSY